jgi:hypothetical protein
MGALAGLGATARRALSIMRSSSSLNFGVPTFYALGCIEPPGETSKTPIDNVRCEAYMEE